MQKQLNKVEQGAHDIQHRKKNRVSGSQLGDNEDRFWDEFEPAAFAWCLVLIVFGLVVLSALVS